MSTQQEKRIRMNFIKTPEIVVIISEIDLVFKKQEALEVEEALLIYLN